MTWSLWKCSAPAPSKKLLKRFILKLVTFDRSPTLLQNASHFTLQPFFSSPPGPKTSHPVLTYLAEPDSPDELKRLNLLYASLPI